jgi:hypothetical protein
MLKARMFGAAEACQRRPETTEMVMEEGEVTVMEEEEAMVVMEEATEE